MMSALDIKLMKLFRSDYVKLNLVDYFTVNSQILKYNLDCHEGILTSVEKEYFSIDGNFDASRFELKNINKLFKSDDITELCKRLTRQHRVVSKKVLLLILQNQLKCQEEFEKIMMIQQSVLNLIKICRLCRQDLNLAKQEFTSSGLQILYYCRKRKLLRNLLNILHNVKTLYHTKDRLQQLLHEENYPKVISLISECQRAAKIYKHYHSIASIDNNLNDILEQVEENLDLSLSKICLNFSVNNYKRLQAAYSFLGKHQTATDQLHMHFTAAVHNTAFRSVVRFAKGDIKRQYNDLCKIIPLDNFLPGLTELCKSLLAIIKSYYLILKWHQNYTIKEDEDNKDGVTVFNSDYVLQKLEKGIIKICYDIENKISAYLDGFDLTPLKFEEFAQTLSVLDRMLKMGIMISRRNMTKLYECVKNKFISYFNFYHTSRLDELKIFLENDGWELCPIKSKFKFTQLLEFKTLNRILDLYRSKEGIDTTALEIINYENYSDYLIAPFYTIFDQYSEEDILQSPKYNVLKYISEDSEDDEIPEELKHDCVEEKGHDSLLRKHKKHCGPIITNTTLTVLRICGKYLQITPLFKDITKIVVQYMIQLFELYFYSVYNFFTVDLTICNYGAIYNTNLKRIISRIKDTLIIDINDNNQDTYYHKVLQPQLSSVDLNDPNDLFGLMERIVATESLIFLSEQYESFRVYLDTIEFNPQDLTNLNQFYLQTIASTTILRKPIYMASIYKAVDVNNVLVLMNKVNWELKDVVSQHSDYIDFLTQEMQTFDRKLTSIQNRIPLSKDVFESIWECVAYVISHTLVQGFSNAKKCTNGGRALMQLDFTQFVSKFEAIASLRPMPYQEYVASYIKAFYLPESSVELWIKKHSEYTAKHLVGLMSCMYQNRKVKQRLISLIEDQRLTR